PGPAVHVAYLRAVAVRDSADGQVRLPAPGCGSALTGNGIPDAVRLAVDAGHLPDQRVIDDREIEVGPAPGKRNYGYREIDIQVLPVDRVEAALREGTVWRESGGRRLGERADPT